MSKLTKTDVAHVAELANLNLSDKEIEEFLPQLSSVIEYITSLNEVDTDGVTPTAQVTGLTNVYRNDEISPVGILSQDEALSGTDETYNGYFKVKAILTERTDK